MGEGRRRDPLAGPEGGAPRPAGTLRSPSPGLAEDGAQHRCWRTQDGLVWRCRQRPRRTEVARAGSAWCWLCGGPEPSGRTRTLSRHRVTARDSAGGQRDVPEACARTRL